MNILEKTGIYLIRDKIDNKVYIGRAKNLRYRICYRHAKGKSHGFKWEYA